MHFWSRSRAELWRKGETSGNTMRVRALRFDCDEDALLALVDPAGPACHTGERTCFHRGELTPQAAEALPALERTIAERAAAADPGTSYTAELLAERRGSATRCARRPARPRAPPQARATSGWPRRPPTCCTTCRS